ncbi:MAG: DUF4390 domain-containing protein, partial [Thermoanaerobaculia bacterium]
MTRGAALLWLLLLLAEGGPEASVSDLQAAVDGQRVLASLVLRNAFDAALVARLQSGLPTPIVYRFELLRDRKRWFDRGVAGNTLEVAAVHDAVTQETTVNYRLDGKLIDSRTVRDERALERAMTRIQAVPVFTLEGLPRGQRLLVRARAELGTRTILALIPV